MATFKTQSGATWDTEKPVRTSINVSNPKLTGKVENHTINCLGETMSMLEVDHDFGKDYIWEDFISQ
jgi:hypothetical protein